MTSASAFGFGLMFPIRIGWRVELSWGRLRQILSIYPAHPLLIPHHWHRLTPPRTLHPCPLSPSAKKMIMPRGFTNYPSLPKMYSQTTINATTTTTKNTRESCKGQSTHACSSRQEAYDSAQRYYDPPIPYWKAILNNYERNNGDDKKDEKVAQRTLHPRLLLPLRGRW